MVRIIKHMEYTEEILEAVKTNKEYLGGANPLDVASFLENVADSLYDGETLEQIANALRDVEEGIAFYATPESGTPVHNA